MVRGEICRRDIHQQRTVDVLPVTGIDAHAVGDGAPRLGGGGHHLTAGADAEAEGAAAVGQVAGQLVGAGRQGRVARQRTVLGGIDGRLAVLDADTHGKGLGLHGKPRLIQHFKGVTGAVTQSQEHMAGGQVIGLPVLADGDGADRAVLYPYMLQPGVEAYVRPGRLQLLPQGLQGDVELVGAHVGLGVGQNGIRCAAADQRLQNEAVAQILRAGVQLAVRKGAGAALAKLDVAVRVQRAAGPEALNVRLTVFYRPAALQ